MLKQQYFDSACVYTSYACWLTYSCLCMLHLDESVSKLNTTHAVTGVNDMEMRNLKMHLADQNQTCTSALLYPPVGPFQKE